MVYSLENRVVIGVSARALFDMRVENQIYEEQGLEAYAAYQTVNEEKVLSPGPVFSLIQALLNLNRLEGWKNRVEVILLSRNNPDISLRIFRSIEYYGLEITRAMFLSGTSPVPYLTAFHTDLFLSACEEDVQAAIDAGIAAGIVCEEGVCSPKQAGGTDNAIRIAFDGDAVLFSDEAEQIFKEHGLEAFESSEKQNAKKPLHAGPFARFLKILSDLQKELPQARASIRTALVTARSAPAHERVIRTLRHWDIRIDEAFFLGGISKKEVLSAFRAQIFFDDQITNTETAAEVVPAARVPLKTRGKEVGLPGRFNIYRLERKIDEVS
ncbi:MAG: 5'-nucleotidase [Lachnospiraceae bacterium]|nr:5'-nucleotidase [Lachnospiraceae bacterium]